MGDLRATRMSVARERRCGGMAGKLRGRRAGGGGKRGLPRQQTTLPRVADRQPTEKCMDRGSVVSRENDENKQSSIVAISHFPLRLL